MRTDDNTENIGGTRPDVRIVFVHGRKPKPPESLYRPQLWRCLLEGVRRADPEVADDMEREGECFRSAGWHDLFYDRDREIGQDLEGIERVLSLRSPAPEDVADARSWNRRLRWFVYHLADRFPWLMTRFADTWIRETVEDTLRYLEDRDGLATRVRERIIRELERDGEDERLLVIGHSLGSVIVYDCLWTLSHELGRPLPVDTLITLGSPLGTRFIQRRLLGFRRRDETRFPRGIRHWYNFATVGDLAALDPDVGDDFAPMLERGRLAVLEDNTRELYGTFRNAAGLNVHRAYGYLVQRAVGSRIAEWWARARGAAKRD